MTRVFLPAFALGMLIATLAMIGLAHAYAPSQWPRPKPRPMMDCWIVVETGAIECEVRK